MEGKGVALLIAIIIGASIVGGMYYVGFSLSDTVKELYGIKNDDKNDDGTNPQSTTIGIPDWAIDYANELHLNGGMIVTKNGSIETITAGQKISADENALTITLGSGIVRYYYEDIRMIRIN